jgi:hypothetical protein
LTYKNKDQLYESIDALPTPGAEWRCDIVDAPGDIFDYEGNRLAEKLELWRKDPVEAIRYLAGHPGFRNNTVWAPEKVFLDPEHQHRAYDEANTADWWWETQVCGPL